MITANNFQESPAQIKAEIYSLFLGTRIQCDLGHSVLTVSINRKAIQIRERRRHCPPKQWTSIRISGIVPQGAVLPTTT